MTRRIIKLDPDHISYKSGWHGSYYNATEEWYDRSWCSSEWKYIRDEKPTVGRWHSCNVFSDETFIRLWFKCSTIQQFCASYEENHDHGYSPSEASCRLRAKNIEKRLGVTLPVLQNESVKRADREREDLRRLVSELEVDQRAEEVGIIPPMLH
tara:strand:+ start:471 stop:932 length:462 start_codon:yes stop_codon:yes gene_type:complete